MLSDRLLSDLTVLMTPDGLTINGSLQDESRLIYQRMLQQFNERYQSPVALIDNVSTSGNGLPFTVVHIMSGPQAHLVTREGRRLYIGDEYRGLRLTRIDDQRIEFEGDRRYEVHW
jgi:type III secretion protein D